MRIIRILTLCIALLPAGFQVFAQQGNAITILSENDKTPLEGAVLIFYPLNPDAKSQVLITGVSGQAVYQSEYSSAVTVKLMGYKIYSDTIQPDTPYTFFLVKENIDLNEVVITGQYNISTTDKSVYSVKVLDEKTIAAKSAVTLSELLSSELGIRLSQDNILGTGVSMNGLAGQNVKILVDGVPVIGRENGNLDISQLNLNDIERVEIIEGPMSVMYGTDAIGGLINLITKKSSRHPLEANVNLRYEFTGAYNADGNISWKKKNSRFSLSGGRYFFDGFSNPDTSRFQQWKPWEKYFGSVQYGFKSRRMDMQAKVDYFHQLTQNKGVPVVTPYEAYSFDDYYTANRFSFTLLNQLTLKNAATMQFTNAYSLYERLNNTYNKNLVALTQFPVEAAGSQDTTWFDAFLFRGTYSHTNPAKEYGFQSGYDINMESGRGKKLADNRQHIYDYALFGSIEFKLDNFLLRPGLRVAYNTRFGAPFIPSLNLKYKLNNRMQLRASYSRGFRAPSLKELDLYFVDVNHNIRGNKNLKAEHSDHYDISLSFQNNFEKQWVKLDYSIFYNNISGIITLAQIDSATLLYSYINIAQYKTAGTKIEAQWKTGSFAMQSGFSLTALYNSLSEQYENVQPFSFTPEFTLGASLHFAKLKSDASLFLKNTGSTPGFALNSQQQVYATTISSFTVLDLVLQKSLGKDRINLSAGAKNLLNVINIKSNALSGEVHSSNDGFLPYATGRYVFVKLNFRLYK